MTSETSIRTAGDLRAFLAHIPDDTLIVIDRAELGRLLPIAVVEDTRWFPDDGRWSDEPGEDGDGTARVIVLTPEH